MKSFREYLEDKDLIDGYAPRDWYSQPIQKKIIAYHGGADFKSFTLDHLGSGEHNYGSGMNPAIGFGVYFSDCKNIASLYTKYWKGKKAIHKVELNATNIYDLRNGTPHLSTAFDDILKELQKTKEDRPFSTFGVYEGLFKMMDKHKAINILIKHGIDGAFARLPMGCLEIAVINLKIIKPIDKEIIEG
jgi:hypothetical protein